MKLTVRQRSHIVETEPFQDTFGPKAQRKKPRLEVGTFEELSKAGNAATEEAEAKATGVTENGGVLGVVFVSNNHSY